MSERQEEILRHLSAISDRMLYRVGRSSPNVGKWTASFPHPRVWFSNKEVAELRWGGKLMPWRGHEDALVLTSMKVDHLL